MPAPVLLKVAIGGVLASIGAAMFARRASAEPAAAPIGPASAPVRPYASPPPPPPPSDAPAIEVESVGVPDSPVAPPADLDPRHALAARTFARLWELQPGQETDSDRALIGAFQAQEGIVPSTGRYGRGTGLAAIKYGIVPPIPFYWPRDAADAEAAKANWRSNMVYQATQDPQRAEEWQRIAMV